MTISEVQELRQVLESVERQIGWHGDGPLSHDHFYCEHCKAAPALDSKNTLGVLLTEKVWQLRERGKELAKNPQEYFRGMADGFESVANELEALDPSSVPVGEQKQEDGV